MTVVVWIIVWAAVIGVTAFLALRERRAGRRVAPGAVRQRRDDTFRMHTGADYYQSRMPPKDPDRH